MISRSLRKKSASPSAFLPWTYEKLRVFQVNQCCFRDLQNPRGQLTLLNMGTQSHVEFLRQVICQNEIQFSVNSLLLSLIIVQRQCWEGNQVEIVLTGMFILICDIANLVTKKQWYSCNFIRKFGKVWVVFYGAILHLAYSMLEISMDRCFLP